MDLLGLSGWPGLRAKLGLAWLGLGLGLDWLALGWAGLGMGRAWLKLAWASALAGLAWAGLGSGWPGLASVRCAGRVWLWMRSAWLGQVVGLHEPGFGEAWRAPVGGLAGFNLGVCKYLASKNPREQRYQGEDFVHTRGSADQKPLAPSRR